MSVYRRAGTRLLWIEYTAHGRRYQVSSGTADRRAAEKREREILRSIEAGTWTPPAASRQRSMAGSSPQRGRSRMDEQHPTGDPTAWRRPPTTKEGS